MNFIKSLVSPSAQQGAEQEDAAGKGGEKRKRGDGDDERREPLLGDEEEGRVRGRNRRDRD